MKPVSPETLPQLASTEAVSVSPEGLVTGGLSPQLTTPV